MSFLIYLLRQVLISTKSRPICLNKQRYFTCPDTNTKTVIDWVTVSNTSKYKRFKSRYIELI